MSMTVTRENEYYASRKYIRELMYSVNDGYFSLTIHVCYRNDLHIKQWQENNSQVFGVPSKQKVLETVMLFSELQLYLRGAVGG